MSDCIHLPEHGGAEAELAGPVLHEAAADPARHLAAAAGHGHRLHVLLATRSGQAKNYLPPRKNIYLADLSQMEMSTLG